MKKIFLLTFTVILGFGSAEKMLAEERIFAVYSESDSILTIYCEDKSDTIGTDWSKYYSSTTKVVFDESIKKALPTTTAQWFESFFKLKSIEHLDYLNTTEVTSMYSMFCACSSLTSLDLKTFDTENVTNMGSMFNSCTALESLNLSSFNTDKVTSMANMFMFCENLSVVDMRNFNAVVLRRTGNMFIGCNKLTTIYCNNDWSEAEDLVFSDNMFTGCHNLEGGNGTKYTDDHTTSYYARPDIPGYPGYFTEKYTDGIDNISFSNKTVKRIENGQLLIIRGDKTYNILGAEVR